MANCIILTGGTNCSIHLPVIQRSLGPYRVASALEDAGYSTFVLDYIIRLSLDEIKQALKQHLTKDTLWVGFSSTFFFGGSDNSRLGQMYYSSLNEIEELFKFIRENSSAKIIYGGAKAPFLLADDRIDYYVLGYADTGVIALTDYLRTGDSKFISETGNVIDSMNYPEPKMDDVSTYWWKPEFNVLPNEGLPIELARGCIFRCKFCSYPLLGKDKGTYLRDPVHIKDELIRIWETTGTTTYYLTDDTFNDDNDKIEALHKAFTELPFKPKFSAYLRIDLLNKYPHQADLLTEMGLIGTYLGIETLQADSAKCIGKGLHPNKVKDRLYWLAEQWKNKVNIASGFILGLPYDSKEYFNELFNWCREFDNPIQRIDFYPLYLYNRPNNARKDELKKYTSEFSLNPEIYGYQFKGEDNFNNWQLDNELTYKTCSDIAQQFQNVIQHRNKIAEFQMITALNIGIELNDLYSLTEPQILQKYDTVKLNTVKLDQYKKLIGIG